MSKARMYGKQGGYVPNARADMRQRKKVYQRGREIAGKAQLAAQERRDRREKEAGSGEA